MINKVFSLLCLIFLFSHCPAQMVNIELRRMQKDSIRFASRNDLSGSYSNNDGEYIYSGSVSSTNLYTSKNFKSVFLAYAYYSLIFGNEEEFDNTSHLHFRYNYRINNVFSGECFVQHSSNRLLDVSQRLMTGFGIRVKLISSENVRFLLGESLLIDHEIGNDRDTNYTLMRNNLYVSASIDIIKEKLELTNIIYWQPAFTDFMDYNILEQLKLDLHVSKTVRAFILFDYFLDTKTPNKEEEYTSDLKFGIGIDF